MLTPEEREQLMILSSDLVLKVRQETLSEVTYFPMATDRVCTRVDPDPVVPMGSVEDGRNFPIPESCIHNLRFMLSLMTEMVRGTDCVMDMHLSNQLCDPARNLTALTSKGAWALPTSAPTLDMQTANGDVLGADICIMGKTTAADLAKHPEFKTGPSSHLFRTPMLKGVANLLGIPIENIFILNSTENLFWVGCKRHLLLAEEDYGDPDVPNLGQVYIREKGANQLEFGYYRAVTITREDKVKGIYLDPTKP